MRRAVAIALLILLPSYVAVADIYRSVDAQGHVQYSDTPSPGAQLISTSDLSAAGGPPSGASAPSRSAPFAQRTDPISQRLAQQAAARAVQQDTSEVRAKQCKQAQENYAESIQARRMYKVGVDGERQYLTDDEADQQRVKNRMAMETACNGVSEQSSSDGDNPPGTTSVDANSTPPTQ